MKSDLSLSQLSTTLAQLLHRYHVILFSLLVLGGLSVATFMLYGIITKSPSDMSASSTSSSFDQTTIKKIQGLRSTSEASQPLELPPGRTNPFQES